MAKLGEEKLGSTQFAQPSPFDPDDRPVLERAKDNVKRAFPTDEGTTWDKLLRVILEEAEIQNEIVENIVDSRFVETATQYQLQLIADYFGIERHSGETDDQFRARIKSQLPRQTTDTTIDEIIRCSSQLINSPPERITVVESFRPHRHQYEADELTDVLVDFGVFEGGSGDEPWTAFEGEPEEGTYLDPMAQSYDGVDWSELDDGEKSDAYQWIYADDTFRDDAWDWHVDHTDHEPARFDVFLEEIAFANTALEIDEYEAMLQQLKAAGVRVNATIGLQFTHRSVADYDDGENNPDKAYDRLNDHVVIDETSEPDRINEQALLDGADLTDDIGGPYADEITRQFP